MNSRTLTPPFWEGLGGGGGSTSMHKYGIYIFCKSKNLPERSKSNVTTTWSGAISNGRLDLFSAGLYAQVFVQM